MTDLAEYCRPQEYSYKYEDQDAAGNWYEWWGYIEAHSEVEAEEKAGDMHFGWWWDLYRVGPVEPERIGR